MPIYEYQCSSCGHRMEKFQKINDAPLSLCPECNTDNLSKLVSAAAFKLKGSGWYETDFKDKKPKTDKDNKKSEKKTNKKGDTSKKANTPAKTANKSNSAS